MTNRGGFGGKNRRTGKNDRFGEKRELLLKEPFQEYAQVQKMLGNGRLTALCIDGIKRLCHIRGKLRKKVWINAGDIVLIALREFQTEKADVIHRYNPDEVRALRQMKEIPETFRIVENVNAEGSDDEDDIGFDSDVSEVHIDIAAL